MFCKKVLRTVTVFLPMFASAQSGWVPTNGPCADAITVFTTHPDGYIFTGTLSNGAYRSLNQGESWEKVNAGLVANNIEDFTVRPQADIFACGWGVHRSSDLGDNWTFLGPSDAVMSIESNSAGDLFAGAWASVYRSTDDGTSWAQLTNDLPTAWVSPILVDAADNIIAGTTFGILRSTNAGENWTFIGPTPLPAAIDLQDLSMNSNGWVCAAVRFEGVYVSTDGGGTWTLSSSGLEDLMVTSVKIDSNNHMLAGSFNGHVYSSTNGGGSWARINTEYLFSEVSSFFLDASGIFVGTFLGGVFQTPDDGLTWVQRNAGFEQNTVYALAANSTGDVFARTRASLYRSTNNGEMWMPTFFGSDGEGTLAVSRLDHLFAATAWTPGQRSTDNGETWTSLWNGINGWISAFGFPSNGDVLALAGGFFRSTDNGDLWALVSQPPSVTTFALTPQDHLFGGTNSGDAVRSTDGGVTWEIVGQGLSARIFSTTMIDAEDRVFIGSLDGGGLFVSSDQGSSWQRLFNGLTDSSIWSVAEAGTGELFVATASEGVFLSADHGNTWTAVNTSLPDTTIYSLAIDGDGYVYAAIAGGGVYRMEIGTTSVREKPLPTAFRLEQNYPNPFNQTTHFGFETSDLGFVSMSIYDLLGREVATLVSEMLAPGVHKRTFDATGLASGMYLYRLRTTGFAQTRKLVLLR